MDKFKANDKLYDITMIRDMIGDDDELRHMIGIFLKSTPGSLSDFNDGYSENNADKIALNAHKMKSSLDMLGIKKLHDDIRKIDKDDKVREISPIELDAIIQKMNAVLEKVFEQLREEFNL